MARILIADDDELAGGVLADALIAAGHGVGLLEDGRAALNAIRLKRPDAVVVDSHMPTMAGPDLVRELRKSPALADLPVLMLTARAGSGDRTTALHAGVDDYMTKPFDADEVVFRVEELLARRAPRAAPPPNGGVRAPSADRLETGRPSAR